MAKKKKKKSVKRREMQEEAKEELEVLAAIFGDHFTLDEDAHGYSLHIVPHPGRTEPNYVSVQMTIRYVVQPVLPKQAFHAGVECWHQCCIISHALSASGTHGCSLDVKFPVSRYPVEYPHQPLVLKLVGTKGLAASDCRALSKLLNSSSSEHAKQGVVAGFSLANACQDFLLDKNSPEAVKNDSTVSSMAKCFMVKPLHAYQVRAVCRLVAPCGTACLSGPACP